MVYRRTTIPTSPLVKHNSKFLFTLSAARSPNRRISLIQTANTEELLALVEIALNVLKSRIPVRAQQKERLKAQAASIRHLSRSRNSDSARKILLSSERDNQQGKGPIGAAILLANIIVPFLKEHYKLQNEAYN